MAAQDKPILFSNMHLRPSEKLSRHKGLDRAFLYELGSLSLSDARRVECDGALIFPLGSDDLQ